MPWLYLAAAILFEVFATSLLKISGDRIELWSTAGIVVGYGAAFVLLSAAFKSIPIGMAYAIWSGAGSALVAIVGWIAFGQSLGASAMLGIGLIVAGVALLASAH